MQRFLLAFLLLGTCLHASTVPCTDIRKVDFRNLTFRTSPKLEQNELNGSDPDPITFRMRHGRAFSFDPPENLRISHGVHEFVATIDSDQLMHPNNSTYVRILQVENSHQTGSGNVRYVLGFTCLDRALTQVFQFSGEGVSLAHFDDRSLSINEAIWADHDAHADPSLYRSLTYFWQHSTWRFTRGSVEGPFPKIQDSSGK